MFFFQEEQINVAYQDSTQEKHSERNIVSILDSDEENKQAKKLNASKRMCKIENSDEESEETNIPEGISHEEVLN